MENKQIISLENTRHWKLNVAMMVLSQVLVLCGFEAAMPFIPLYLKEGLGIMDEGDRGLYLSLFNFFGMFAYSIFNPLWGVLSDRWGVKPMLIRGTFLTAVFFPMMAYVSNPWLLIALRFITAACAGTTVAAQTLLVKNTPEEKQGFALGMLTTAYWCGIMLGSVVGGLVVSYYGYKNTFWFCGILYFLAGVAVLFARDDYIPGRNKTGEPAEKRSFREFMRTVFPAFTIAVRLLLLLTFLSGVVCSFSPAYIPMLIERITGIKEAAFWTGITSAVAAAGSILSGVVIGAFADRAKPLRLLIPIFIITGLCLYIQAVSPGLFADPETQWVICGKTFSVNLDLLVLGISRFLQLLVLGGSGAIFMKMLSNSTPKRKRGAVFGYRSTAYQIGGMLASFCGGGLMFLCNDARSVFYVGALLFLLLIPMTVWIVRRVESQPFYKDHASLAEK